MDVQFNCTVDQVSNEYKIFMDWTRIHFNVDEPSTQLLQRISRWWVYQELRMLFSLALPMVSHSRTSYHKCYCFLIDIITGLSRNDFIYFPNICWSY